MNQSFTGRSSYLPDCPTDTNPLIVAIPCRIGELGRTVHALLDTAAEWPVLNSEIASALGYDSESEGLPIAMLTRRGRKEGVLLSIPVCFPADDGEDLYLEARWFVCDDWVDPPVLGWRGCLQWMRFALNPDEDSFYFAQVEGTNPDQFSDWGS